MSTIAEQLKEAQTKCNAYEISKQMDKLKNDEGFLDCEKLQKFVYELKKFGPYYHDLFRNISKMLDD